MRRMGENTILLWPGGFAAEVPDPVYLHRRNRCCEGHPTPQAAAEHGLAVNRAYYEQAAAAWREER